MESMETAARHYAVVERAIVWLNEHAAEQPSLDDLEVDPRFRPVDGEAG